MAGEKGTPNRKTKPANFFFLNGDLHKKIHINRAGDLLTAWNYPQGKRVSYIWSEAKKKQKKAYTTKEVAELLGRAYLVIHNYIWMGGIKRPQMTYPIQHGSMENSPGPFHGGRHNYFWSEEDILELRDWIASRPAGRPRKDGLITKNNVPSKKQLLAMMHHDAVFYIKTKDGFVPTWDAPEF